MINAGLSVGIVFLDNPPVTWEMGEGTRERPDKMIFGRVRVVEVSLTPVPRIYTAGLLGPGKELGEKPAEGMEDTGNVEE